MVGKAYAKSSMLSYVPSSRLVRGWHPGRLQDSLEVQGCNLDVVFRHGRGPWAEI